jgi:hypothetical protein
MRIAFLLLCVALITTPARGALSDRVVHERGSVVLAAAGTYPGRVAFLAASRERPCGAVRVWLLSPGTVQTISGPCRDRSERLYGLALAGESALWASRRAGTYSLWLAESSPLTDRYTTPRVVARSRTPFVVGDGNGRSMYAYATGRRVVFGTTSWSRSRVLPSPVVAVAVASPYVAVRELAGPVTVFLGGDINLAPAARIDYPPGAVKAVKMQASTLIVLRDGRLERRGVYWPSARPSETIRLPRARSYGDDHCGVIACPVAELRLADLQGDLVSYVDKQTVHLARLSTGRDVVLRERPGMVHAELEATGLYYSSTDRIGFVPRPEIDRRLRG